MTERMRRWRPSNFAPPATPLRVANALGTDGGTASLYLYDAIDEWGGEWGVSAAEFVAALTGIQAGQIDLHLNSPGGSYYEAVAMRAALVAHPAAVHVYVDGLAASAASILATVGDRVVMAPGSQQMIHKASSITWGNADQMREDAGRLDEVDQLIAGFYLARAGQGTADSWLALMAAETWYSPDEAVAAGLADEVAAQGGPQRGETAPDEQVAAGAPDRWIVAAWKYAGRENAPAPQDVADVAPPATAPDPPTPVVATPGAPADAPPATELPTAAGFTLAELTSAIAGRRSA